MERRSRGRRVRRMGQACPRLYLSFVFSFAPLISFPSVRRFWEGGEKGAPV